MAGDSTGNDSKDINNALGSEKEPELEIELPFDLEASDDFPFPPISSEEALAGSRKYVAYTIKLPSEQLAALQSIWLELKRMYGTHSPDKSGIIQQAITEWLMRWDGPDRAQLLRKLLEIRENTRRRQYRK